MMVPNISESLVCVLAAASLVLYARRTFESRRWAWVSLAICALPLWLSIEGFSRFLTVDETYLILETTDLKHSGMEEWFSSTLLRSTDAFIGPPVALAKFLFGLGPEALKVWAKSLHWLAGFWLFLAIHRVLARHFVSVSSQRFFWIGYLWCSLLLPSNILALKVFNYDLLSMQFGVLALLFAWLAFRFPTLLGYSLASIVLGTLAAQEKMTSSPILVLSCASLGYYVAHRNKGWSAKILSPLGVVVGMGLSILIGFLSALPVWTVRGALPPNTSFGSSASPLLQWSYPVAIFMLGGARNFSEWELLRVTFLASAALLVAILIAVPWIRRTIDRHGARLSTVGYLFGMGFFAWGVAASFTVRAFWSPFRSIEAQDFHPKVIFNGATTHFGAADWASHLAHFVSFYVAIFVNAVPSAFWVLVALVTWGFAKRKSTARFEMGALMFVAGLAVPILFGLAQLPTGQRYINLALWLSILGLLLAFTHVGEDFFAQVRSRRARRFAWAGVGCLGALWLVEMLPFRPLFAPFRPIWNNYSAEYRQYPAVGEINPSWIGWGEELFLAGQILQRSGQLEGLIRIYHGYPGEWLGRPAGVETIYLKGQDPGGLKYGDRDFYLFNRSIVVQGMRFPADIPALARISFRGFDQAWLYRGSDLAKGGFVVGH